MVSQMIFEASGRSYIADLGPSFMFLRLLLVTIVLHTCASSHNAAQTEEEVTTNAPEEMENTTPAQAEPENKAAKEKDNAVRRR